ncbi:hypothetical protein B0H11DRAFT_2252630 [Mycena galericulata]|nr:hypothetical protein B0H11DRAFT_2252630 [Mycena galericulata]
MPAGMEKKSDFYCLGLGTFDLVSWYYGEPGKCKKRDESYDLASYESSTDSDIPSHQDVSSSESENEEELGGKATPAEFIRDNGKIFPRRLGDLLKEAVWLILEVSQSYPGNERPVNDERRQRPHFGVEYFDEISVLPMEYLRVPAFSNIRAIESGTEDFDFLRTHRATVKELLADELRRYLAENSEEYPIVCSTLVCRTLREPELDRPDLFVDFISERDSVNPMISLIGWILTRQDRTLFGDERVPEDETEFFCGKVQFPVDGFSELRRTASMHKIANRVVAKPIVVVAHALIDSGSEI